MLSASVPTLRSSHALVRSAMTAAVRAAAAPAAAPSAASTPAPSALINAAQSRSLSAHAAARPSAAHRAATTQTVSALSASRLTARSMRSFHTSTAASGIVPFNLADIGEGIAEAEVLQWFVNVGDKVVQFDKICEVQSDKATVEITSRYEGTVAKLYYKVHDMAKVGSVLVDIDVAGAAGAGSAAPSATPAAAAASATSASSASSSAAAAAAAPAAAASDALSLATPAVRRLIKEHNLSLKQIVGTGRDGRVLKEDVLNFVANGGRSAAPAAAAPVVAAAPASTASAAASTATTATPAAAPVSVAPVRGDRVEPIRGFKRTMIKSMNAANLIPHFNYCDEIVMNRLISFRTDLKPLAESRGVKLTYMPIMIKAASLALLRYPILNSSLNADATEITYKGSHNIGVAMDTPGGLVVPNIKNVQDKSIFEVAAELNRLQQAGSKGQLRAEDLTGGTFTLSNIGTVGGTYMKPIIVVPEVAIGAIGKIQKLPRFNEDDSVYAAHIMQVSWSADHRVIDGVTMASFSNLWKSYIENPQSMVVDLK
ncbi:dihydrolipoyl transacylase [Capsaspora owczarzaki ATCC 30864]|uniref:Dihydrolipoamide acetyltransferase component of pyruvate dehydrogenase complex n=1 Tax=Capsaspora owczarzaki (strain ATCC 30864) TaxID=595528 RepID=A0A0D2WGZ6_CAPO3|nr:dihydrolipoyl transacylase [Capsaspora owczarzaki ATCC 30864]KJE88780.1 dihydrolipoyl transacylase [Capsaspora owczarzaki ATCC 30864]|eukprot:XP_004365239.2 dihydrolipoyl transacylase [Capsaspora owczarzaki ATCC 30864]